MASERRRRRRVAAVAVLAAVSTGALARTQSQPGAATPKPSAAPQDSPAFAAYRRLCLDTQADPSAVLAAAQSQGWSPARVGDALPLGALAMSDGAQREMTADGRRLRLAVGHAPDPASLGLKAQLWRVCIVSAAPAEPTAAAALAATAAVAPTPGSSTDGTSTLYIIADPLDARRRSAAGLSDTELQSLVEAGRVQVLGVQTAGPITVLLAAEPGR